MQQENVVISTLKKADLSSNVMLRLYEIEGSPIKTSLKFQDKQISFNEVNLLEEEIDRTTWQTLQGRPYAIKTIRFNLKSIKQ